MIRRLCVTLCVVDMQAAANWPCADAIRGAAAGSLSGVNVKTKKAKRAIFRCRQRGVLHAIAGACAAFTSAIDSVPSGLWEQWHNGMAGAAAARGMAARL
jgi:hypothetical protein